MPLTVVLDADVLIAAPLRDTLLRAAHAGLCRTCYSAEILEEVRRNLVAKRGLSTDAAQRTIDRLRAFPHKELVDVSLDLIPLLATDPDDSHVLPVAIRAKADVIVTVNVRHFPAVNVH
jgi:predicted nucleic acid-binding protein